mmetsp:Transcript_65811/g.206111  ORF Transcript_65811/g.206111 Transcript_65811/m.206111 type:complete len:695 (+) Transcript_65811:191-2275(+)
MGALAHGGRERRLCAYEVHCHALQRRRCACGPPRPAELAQRRGPGTVRPGPCHPRAQAPAGAPGCPCLAQRECTVDTICERLLPVLTSDSDLEGGVSAKSLKEGYEALIAEQKKAAARKRTSVRSGPRTARECDPARRVTADGALAAVAKLRGSYNWVLLEPTNLELHNAGYGGLEELKAWLEEDKVLFGVIRFTFGSGKGCEGNNGTPSPDSVKHVFVHWVGPSVPAVRRGQWNMQQKEADARVRKVCPVITLRREVHTPEDLNVSQIIAELRRLSTVEGTSEGAADKISVEEYMAALQQECLECMEADKSDGEEEALPQALPDVSVAVDGVRKAGGGTWNWLLVGFGSQTPAQQRLSVAGPRRSLTLSPRGEPVISPRDVHATEPRRTLALTPRDAPAASPRGRSTTSSQCGPADSPTGAPAASPRGEPAVSPRDAAAASRAAPPAAARRGEPDAPPRSAPSSLPGSAPAASPEGDPAAPRGGTPPASPWGNSAATPTVSAAANAPPSRQWTPVGRATPAAEAVPAASAAAPVSPPLPSGSSASRRLATPVLQLPTCEVKPGPLRLRTGWWWSRRHFELRAGHLRWWRQEQDYAKEVDPLGDLALVEGEKRWRVEHIGGARLELTRINGAGRINSVERYILEADGEQDAVAWAEAIGQHVRYVDMLLCWPLPLEGRQGDVRSYGISYPEGMG